MNTYFRAWLDLGLEVNNVHELISTNSVHEDHLNTNTNMFKNMDIPDPGSCMQDTGSWVPDSGTRTWNSGFWIQDPGSRTLDP